MPTASLNHIPGPKAPPRVGHTLQRLRDGFKRHEDAAIDDAAHALLEIKVFLILFLRRFRVEWASNAPKKWQPVPSRNPNAVCRSG